jgi:mannose-1-phosphate guanylyltransferase
VAAFETFWGVVLAAGSGSRLTALTTDAAGTVVPKQFCSFMGGPSLLRTTIERLSRVVDPSRIVVVVSAMHRRWWEPELAGLPPENIVIQPCDRGTACGLLLPLLSIETRDPGSGIVVSPADNFVEDEDTFILSLATAQTHVLARPARLVLLGMSPERPDTEYGWISPAPRGTDTVPAVSSFVEKPDARRAEQLMQSGALWSSLTFVTTCAALMDRFRRSMPWLVDRFTERLVYAPTDHRQYALLSLYDRLPTVDFSRRVLEHSSDGLHVLPVPPCGWTDLGTPQRVSECAMRRASSSNDPAREAARAMAAGTVRSSMLPSRPRSCPVDLAEEALRALGAHTETAFRERRTGRR